MTKRDDPAPNYPARNHVTDDLLIRAMDDELSPSEIVRVEAHVAQCDVCKKRYNNLRVLSDRIEALASAPAPQTILGGREVLARRLDARQSHVVVPDAGKVLRRFGWGMAIAATLALGIVFAPGRVQTPAGITLANSGRSGVETFEVNGETFVSLPYSNPDLPVSTSHVVQMQVPVSSLAEAGVAFEPVSAQGTALDHSVLADVVVGLDGQPLGVHVLTAE